jgi:hypothetical protein
MKNGLRRILFCAALMIISCNNQSKPDTEKAKRTEIQENNREQKKTEFNKSIILENWQELTLIQTDDRYGEWGGNTFVIKIYKNSTSNNYFADYKEYKGSTEPPPPPKHSNQYFPWYIYKPVINQKNEIKLNENQIELIHKAVISLTSQKLSNENLLAHSGIKNEIILKDSTFIINDFPSFKWNEFHKLKRIIIEK